MKRYKAKSQKACDSALKPVQPEIHLRADQDVPYRHVAQTLADATKAGLSKVGFVSQPEP